MSDIYERLKKYEPVFGSCMVEKEPIGSGSSCEVYKIYNPFHKDMTYAIKVISVPKNRSELDDMAAAAKTQNIPIEEQVESWVSRYKVEINTMYSLKRCPNIVEFLNSDFKDFETDRGSMGKDILIQMEFLTNLTAFLGRDGMSVEEKINYAVRLGIDICTALEELQKRNIIHRDIKPDNIFYCEQEDIFKLGDFGTAKVMKTRFISSEKGTPLFSAPEIAKLGVIEAGDTRSDLYSLGLVMYMMMNDNMLPFAESYRDRDNANSRRLGGEKFPRPSMAKCEERLTEIVMKACEYNPDDRYANPSLMKAELLKLPIVTGNTPPKKKPDAESSTPRSGDTEKANGGGSTKTEDANGRGDDYTMPLDAEATAYLQRENGEEKYIIENNVFTIGRNKENLDINFERNPSISRMHAYITYKAEGWYIVDKESQNGTYINGAKMDRGREYQLKDKDMVVFSGRGGKSKYAETFIFRIDAE